ncbi:MAG TPA: FtsW/RodA/SpoVE family cell cycle protein, partial [Coriobacteriia bacterium]|nr:FtsW/RodA/SpoVE family cell cycle protein [Coriobacteriia bacterium]
MRREAPFAGGPLPRYLLLGSTLFLVLFGALMVYSASSVVNFVSLGDSAYHFRRQLAGIILGAVLLIVAMRVDYRRVRLVGPATWLLSVLLLLVVLINGVGKWGATRWIDVGPLTVQPSELAKIGCVMVAALLVHQYGEGRIAASAFWKRLGLTVGSVSAL